MEKIETIFTRHLEVSGWPPAGHLANADVFDRFVQPLLQESGRRVAYILVDALRYELGVALHAQLADTEQVELMPACAQLPSVTPVGMASLLPGAGQALRLLKEGQGFVAALGENSSAYLTDRYGLITDYLAEAFHYQLKHSNRFEEVSKRVRLGRAVEGRDEKGIKKTLCAFLKVLHPTDLPNDEEFDEYVTYAVECRRRIKEQMNKRKPDDEFAKINLSFTDRTGKEVIVFCPESSGASATLEPLRRRLHEVSGKDAASQDSVPSMPASTPPGVSA
jgi:hypothetical protein